MANAAIGEINLTIGEREFTLRPSFSGLAEIESRADCGILSIAKDISEGKMKLRHIVAIVYGGILGALPRGEKPDVSFDELGELIVSHGYAAITTPVVMFFAQAIKGDPLAEKKTQ